MSCDRPSHHVTPATVTLAEMKSVENYCLLCFFNVLLLTTATHKVDVCYLSSSAHQEDVTSFTELCHQYGGDVTGRCCVTHPSGDTPERRPHIIGVDLRSCDAHTLDLFASVQNLQQSPMAPQNKGRIEILLLDDSALRECNNTIFDGMTLLNYLSLPSHCGCPGGTDAWESSEIQNNNEICRNITDICVTENVTCPQFSHCVVHAPGVTWCTCDKDHHGYKCLHRGAFPTVLFAASTVGIVVALSAVMWATVRRKVQ